MAYQDRILDRPTPTSIQTFTGIFFDPFDPDPPLIDIRDIAHALSLQCRFSGHTRRHTSVAEHCIRVANACPPDLRLEGLLHDAAEAYLVDLPRPIKHDPGFAAYLKIEERIELAIAERFRLCYPWPQPVKQADNLILWAESEALMHGTGRWVSNKPDDRLRDQIAYLADEIRGRPYSFHAAETAFLAYFESLKR